MELVKVFKHDGSIQCGYSDGQTLEELSNELVSLGGDVQSSEYGYLPVIQVCGYPTGRVAVCTITKESWFTVSNGFVGPNGWGLWPYSEQETVEVYKYDGTRQCGEGFEISLEQMAKELTSAGIEIIEQRKGSDGMIYTAVCGGGSGSINVFKIRSSDAEAAGRLGFMLFVRRDDLSRIDPNFSGTNNDAWPFPW